MLDHVFTDAIGALRDVLEDARLERHAAEERFASDVLLGDLTWETSYALPGEGLPPRVRCDITLEWSSWSQTIYRGWYQTGDVVEPPRIDVSIVMRLQRLAARPEPETVMAALPTAAPRIGDSELTHAGPTIEHILDEQLADETWAIEVSYNAAYELGDDALADGAAMDNHFASLGGWVSSTLVRLGDLRLTYRPPDEAPPGNGA